ncbi:MAG: tRNA 2-thiouridine(34) synthase MnmA [bacterium]|nr:tRNA 2-thiouridine(34) synthase MnmA [bacterium]
MNKSKGTVFVGLSGGVDSSVSAALLKKEGYDVTGVFIKVWQPDFLPCTWKEDRFDAMRVAAHLDIPFITLDLEKEYKKEVVDYMIAEYKKGRTPNPDVMCNQYVKFGAFFKKAIAAGADFVATGHYARVARGDRRFLQTKRRPTQKKSTVGYTLLAGVDTEKDQSYFLWTLTQKELSKTLFPVGGYEKPEVRKLAKKFGLPTAEKKDSQGLCFMGKLDMKDFLKHFIKEKVGDVLDVKGVIIGEHKGAVFFTLGERHGFTITQKGTHDVPYYVVEKDIIKNTITVSHGPISGVDVSHEPFEIAGGGERKRVNISHINWIRGVSPKKGDRYTARVRYRQPLETCTIVHVDIKNAEIIFANSQIASPGQSLVLYDGDECLGGGVVD